MSLFAYAFNEDIKIKRYKGISSMGSKEYESPELIKGRLTFGQSVTIDKSGQETLSQATLLTEAKLSHNDLVLYGDIQLPVQNISEKKSLFDGLSHYEIKL